MIPVFTSTYSVGKSILQIKPQKNSDGPDSIVDICKEHNFSQLFLIEDNPTGFMEAHKFCSQMNIQLIFGMRFTCCNDTENPNTDSNHRIVLVAKNDQGCLLLNTIYSHVNLKLGGRLDFKYLNKVWDEDLLALVIPFYDSFIFNNTLSQGNCIPHFNKIRPTFFIENNNLPFDQFIATKVSEFAKKLSFKEVKVKSIYYKNRADATALQTYKILCNRQFGKEQTLSRPELNHFGSDEFCLESYLEYERRIAQV